MRLANPIHLRSWVDRQTIRAFEVNLKDNLYESHQTLDAIAIDLRATPIPQSDMVYEIRTPS
jgi:hypothetical protein